MPNPYRKCDKCGLNHRPGNCRKKGGCSLSPVPGGFVAPEGLQKPSRVTFVVDLSPVLAVLARIEEKLDRMEIAKREVPAGGEGR